MLGRDFYAVAGLRDGPASRRHSGASSPPRALPGRKGARDAYLEEQHRALVAWQPCTPQVMIVRNWGKVFCFTFLARCSHPRHDIPELRAFGLLRLSRDTGCALFQACRAARSHRKCCLQPHLSAWLCHLSGRIQSLNPKPCKKTLNSHGSLAMREGKKNPSSTPQPCSQRWQSRWRRRRRFCWPRRCAMTAPSPPCHSHAREPSASTAEKLLRIGGLLRDLLGRWFCGACRHRPHRSSDCTSEKLGVLNGACKCYRGPILITSAVAVALSAAPTAAMQ